MYLLDTDTLTMIELEDPATVQRLSQVDSDEVAISVITRIEALQGRFAAVVKAADSEALLRAMDRLARTDELLDELIIIPIDLAAATTFDQLRAHKKLNKIGRADLLIASIALAHRATLVTRNVRHFRQVPGLQVENWAD